MPSRAVARRRPSPSATPNFHWNRAESERVAGLTAGGKA